MLLNVCNNLIPVTFKHTHLPSCSVLYVLLLNRKGWFLWHFLNLCSTFILLLSCFLSCCTRKRTKIHVFVPAAVRWWRDFAVDGLFLAAFLICQHVHIDRSTPPSHEWAFDVKEQTICRSLGRETQRSISHLEFQSALMHCFTLDQSEV